MKSQTTHNQLREPEAGAREFVQQRAYDLYMKRGQEPGHELEDWLLAEQQVRQERERGARAPVSH